MVEKLVKRFGMSDFHPKVVPADPNMHLSSNVQKSEGERTIFPHPYREAVGALLYVSLMTRPDISYAVGQVSKHCQNPNQSHWEAVEQIFAYLVGTMDYGIWLGAGRRGLIGYTDADFAGDRDDCSSTSGGGGGLLSTRRTRGLVQQKAVRHRTVNYRVRVYRFV